jgi:hypothetical protein
MFECVSKNSSQVDFSNGNAFFVESLMKSNCKKKPLNTKIEIRSTSQQKKIFFRQTGNRGKYYTMPFLMHNLYSAIFLYKIYLDTVAKITHYFSRNMLNCIKNR